MLNSLKSKVKTLIFHNEDTKTVNESKLKRKRSFDDTDFGDEVEIVTVKKPRLQRDPNQSLLQRFFSTPILQSMSDWVQKKTPTLNLWQSGQDNSKDRKFKSNVLLDFKRKSEPINRTNTNGGSHHRFDKVDMPTAYMKGSWPFITKNSAETLTRRPLRGLPTKSTTVQTDSVYDTHSREDSNGVEKFRRSFRSKKQKFTARESIRIGDKVRYQQLLQQFTTVPLEQPDISHPVDIQQPVIVPQLPRFYCHNNDSILGSKLSTWQTHNTQPPDKSRIKVHPNSRSTPRTVVNGMSGHESPINITDISAIPSVTSNRKSSVISQQRVIDLTEDEEVQIISEERPNRLERPRSATSLSRVKSPIVSDYRSSKFMSEDWIKDLNNTYGTKARERQRKLAEEELKAKVINEQRQKQEEDLERRIRRQMRIYAKQPPVTEEPEAIEIESSSSEEEEFEEGEDDEIEEALPELTNEMENHINKCLRGGPTSEVLVDKFRLQITRADIATLSGLNWLNDEVINFYMNLLMERGEKEGMPKVYAFNTFFYPKVMSGGQSAVKRWTRRVDVLAVDYILIPVHLGMHWCLAVIDFKKKDIQYYDSMGGSNTECLSALKKYLCDESLEKKKKEFDLSGWKYTIVKDIPQQMNGSDCGMFACKFAEYITREKPITFSQQHMPYFRRRMVYEITKAKLLQ